MLILSGKNVSREKKYEAGGFSGEESGHAGETEVCRLAKEGLRIFLERLDGVVGLMGVCLTSLLMLLPPQLSP